MGATTSRIGLYKPGGGSTGTITPDETADIDKLNQNFDKIDAAVGAQVVTSTTRPAAPYNGQLIKETDTGRALYWSSAAAQWLDVSAGSVPGGTTAMRDAYWGSPAGAPERVQFANRALRWFNTDKGYEQQYFSAATDPGANPFVSKKVAGWYPLLGAQNGVFATAVSSAGGTATKSGDLIEFTGATTVAVTGIFSADFENYEIDVDLDAGGANGQSTMRMRAGTTDDTGAAAYGSNFQTFTTAPAATPGYGAGSSWTIGRTSTGAVMTRILLQRPQLAKVTLVHARSHGFDGAALLMSGHHTQATAYDGFSFTAAAGVLNGQIRVRGIG